MTFRANPWIPASVLLAAVAPAFAAEQLVAGKITKWEGKGAGLMTIGVGASQYLMFRGKSTTSIEQFPQQVYVRITDDVKVRLPIPAEKGDSRRKREKPDPDDKDPAAPAPARRRTAAGPEATFALWRPSLTPIMRTTKIC